MLINHFKKLTVIYDIILLLEPNIIHKTRINQLLVSHQIVEQSARSDIYWLFDHHQLRKLLVQYLSTHSQFEVTRQTFSWLALAPNLHEGSRRRWARKRCPRDRCPTAFKVTSGSRSTIISISRGVLEVTVVVWVCVRVRVRVTVLDAAITLVLRFKGTKILNTL